MSRLLIDLGFSELQISFMLLSGFSAMIGSFVQIVVSHWGGFPKTAPTEKPRFLPPLVSVTRLFFYSSRLLVGGILGFFFGLYLCGALVESDVSVSARVLPLAALLGYSAPEYFRKAAALRELTPSS